LVEVGESTASALTVGSSTRSDAMTKPPSSVPSHEQPSNESLHDRRSNPELRRLIEEMLERVRQMNRNIGIWSPDERARAEADLESVMARVRRLAGERRG
jgi:hypothetical protein